MIFDAVKMDDLHIIKNYIKLDIERSKSKIFLLSAQLVETTDKGEYDTRENIIANIKWEHEHINKLLIDLDDLRGKEKLC
jgi:hypothetical protein